jgi:hypothetical protein
MRSEAVVAEIGSRRHGVVPTDVALEAGATEHGLKYLRRRGLLVPVGRGVDRLRDHPFAWPSRCQAALDLAPPGSVLGLRTAARLHGIYQFRATDRVEVLARRGRDHETSVGRLVQTRWMPGEHTCEVDGFPVTTLARTFFDLCGDPEWGLPVAHRAHERAMVRVYNDALGRRGLTFTQEAAVLLVMAKRGRAGTQLTGKILERFGPKYTPTRSDTETLFLELVHAYGLPEPAKQVPISDERGFIGTVDFVWCAPRVVAEVDSSWHDGPLDEEVDEERDERLRAAGYTVDRWRYGDIVRRPGVIARKLGMVTSNMST